MTAATDTGNPWLTADQAAAVAQYNPQTISKALRTGELRGHQRVRKGKWLVHRDDLDAWIRGEKAPAEPDVPASRPHALPR